MQGKKILVAGGSGLVGCNLTKRLLPLGAEVFSSFFSRKPDAITQDVYQYFDFTQFKDCLEATRQKDYVIICAAQVFGVQMMKENPTVSILPNLKMIAGLLEGCSRNQVKKVVLLSSTTVYQEAFYPIREDQLDLNLPPYSLYQGVGWLNRYLEQLASFYYNKKQLPIGIIRPTNIYGPYDQFDDDKSHVLPALIKRALKKEDPFLVWGNGAAMRDFIFVEDLVDIILEILDQYCVCDPINVAHGTPMSIRDAVEIILKICDHTVTPQYDPTKPNALPYRAVDITKCNSLFGQKEKTTFITGIQKTKDWFQSINLNKDQK